MSLQMDSKQQGEAIIVRLAGELDHHTATTLKSRLEQAIESGSCKHIIFNLKALQFMDSSGIGVILGRYKQIAGKGGRMIICEMNPSLQRLFEMSGMLKIMKVAESESSALASLEVVS